MPFKAPPHPVGKITELFGTTYLIDNSVLFVDNHRTNGRFTIRNLWIRLVASSIARANSKNLNSISISIQKSLEK